MPSAECYGINWRDAHEVNYSDEQMTAGMAPVDPHGDITHTDPHGEAPW